MSVRAIRRVPDPVLRAPCEDITAFDDALADLAGDMLDTMYAAPGRGLAAPQVGESLRLFVMDAGWKDGAPDPQVFVNPRIVTRSTDTIVMEEGCLSIPGTLYSVSRPAGIDLLWLTLDGETRQDHFAGFPARCIQHEVDHLDGILCIDYPKADAP